MGTGAIGFYPFWFWNDTLKKEEIAWQIRQMKEQGIRGFFIHPRQGLGQPYLSNAFLEQVECAIREAETHGMEVHLYDEFPYPSGIAGGEVTLGHPEFMATQLISRIADVSGGDVREVLPAGDVLSAKAYPLDESGNCVWEGEIDLIKDVGVQFQQETYTETGLTDYNRKRFLACEPAPVLQTRLPEGTFRLNISVQALIQGHKYWGHYADVLNPEAVRRFIALTHERYAERFGTEFGTRIRSIFVDETAPHWSALIPEAFRRAHGYDLIECLPALHDESHPKHMTMRADLERCRLEMFEASFEKQIGEWCRNHNILYSGEKPSSRFSQLRHMDLPGCDCGHTKAGRPPRMLSFLLRDNAKAAASAAYFYDKPGSIDECYHSIGWSGTLQDAKLLAEGMVLMGITHLVPHGFFYSTHALKKHDAPPSFFFQMPYWPYFGRLSERLERLGQEFARTWEEAKILVIDPNSGLPSDTEKEAYERLLSLLMGNHLAFYIGDTDVLAGRTLRDGALHLRDIAVEAVIVPPMQHAENALEEELARCEAGGVAVIRLEASADKSDILRAVHERAKPFLSIRDEDGEAAGVWSAKRTDGTRAIHFLLNTTDRPMRLQLEAARPLREIPLDDQPAMREPGDNSASIRDIAPFQSILLEECDEAPPAGEGPPLAVQVALNGPAGVNPLNKNLLRLSRFSMSIIENGEPAETAVVDAAPILKHLSSGGFRFAPEMTQGFGRAATIKLPTLQVRYETAFHSSYEGPVWIVMEPGSMAGEWSLRLNQSPEFKAEDFGELNEPVRGNLGLDVSKWICSGVNRLSILLETSRPDGGLLNPLYLAGGFSAVLNPLGIAPPVRSGRFEQHEQNGLPFYAGCIEYSRTIALPALPEGRDATLRFDCDFPFRDAALVSLNNGEWRELLWEPRSARVPASELLEGENDLRIRVYTSLLRAFEGERFDEESHASRRTDYTLP
jgi:hypothetical protein